MLFFHNLDIYRIFLYPYVLTSVMQWIFTTDAKNNLPEITDLLRNLQMLQSFGGKH